MDDSKTDMMGSASPDPESSSWKLEIPDYSLLRLIGRGSFGEVWLARDVMDNHRAIKVVRRENFDSDHDYEREFEGIRAFEPVSRKDNAFLRILHAARRDGEGYYYYVMELADREESGMDDGDGGSPFDPGTYKPRTLSHVIETQGRLPAERCVRIGMELAAGLEILHLHKLVHRDIKPANIIFVDGRLKLADIGLVTVSKAACSFVGTEGFIPPEGPGTPRADVFSLGKVLYELSTGKDRRECPAPLSAVAALPDHKEYLELNEVILRACDRDYRKRYASADALRADLALLAVGKSLIRARKLERTWAIAKPIMLALAALLVVGSAIAYLLIDASRKEARATQSLLKEQQRQVFMQKASREVLGSQVAGWSDRAWEQIRQAAAIWIDDELRVQAPLSLAGFDAGLLKAFVPHAASHVAFDSDGARLLVAGRLNGAGIWNGDMAAETLQSFPESGDGPVAFRSDGRAVQFRKGGSQLVLWDLAEGKVLREFLLEDGSDAAMPDSSRDTLRGMTPDAAFVAALAYSADRGERIVVWKAGSGQLIRTFKHPEVSAMAMAPDGSVIAIGDDKGGVTVWRVDDGTESASLKAGTEPIRSLALSRDLHINAKGIRNPDWLLAAGDSVGNVGVWELSSKTRRTRCFGSEYDVFAVAFSPDGVTLASAGRVRTKLWDVATGHLRLNVNTVDHVHGLAFSPDGRKLAVSTESSSVENRVSVWNLEPGRGVKSLRGLASHVSKVCYSPDSRWIAALAHNWEIGIWDTANGSLRWVLEAQRGVFADNAALGFSPDGQRFAFLTGEEVRVWDLARGSLLKAERLPGGLADELIFAEPNRILLFRMDLDAPRAFVIREFFTDQSLKKIKEIPTREVEGALSIPEKNCFVVVGVEDRDGRTTRVLRAFDALTGGDLWEPLALDRTEGGTPLTAYTDSNGTFLCTMLSNDGPDARASILDVSTGKVVKQPGWHAVPRAIGRRGDLWVMTVLTAGRESGWSFYERGRSAPLVTLDLYSDHNTNLVAFDRSGNLFAWGNDDGTVSLCDLTEVQEKLEELRLWGE